MPQAIATNSDEPPQEVVDEFNQSLDEYMLAWNRHVEAALLKQGDVTSQEIQQANEEIIARLAPETIVQSSLPTPTPEPTASAWDRIVSSLNEILTNLKSGSKLPQDVPKQRTINCNVKTDMQGNKSYVFTES